MMLCHFIGWFLKQNGVENIYYVFMNPSEGMTGTGNNGVREIFIPELGRIVLTSHCQLKIPPTFISVITNKFAIRMSSL